jgi:hypothetical protein
LHEFLPQIVDQSSSTTSSAAAGGSRFGLGQWDGRTAV